MQHQQCNFVLEFAMITSSLSMLYTCRSLQLERSLPIMNTVQLTQKHDPTLPACNFPWSSKAFIRGPTSRCGLSASFRGAGLEFRALKSRVAGFAMILACCSQLPALKSSLSFGFPGTKNPAKNSLLSYKHIAYTCLLFGKQQCLLRYV